MLLDAEEFGSQTAILCVTNDQGFGETLACCGQFGALTVAGELLSQQPGNDGAAALRVLV